jgi:ABC-type sulfate transport system substrate-binding protein
MYSMSNRNSEELKKPQKRLEYIGKNVRVSRTGGAAVTKTFKKDGVGATLKKLPSLNDKKAKDKVKGFD